MTTQKSREGLRQVVVEATESRTVGLCFRRGPCLASFLFIENWDSRGFCGHQSGLVGKHATWLDARCLGKLVPQLGAHGMKLDRVLLLGENYLSQLLDGLACCLIVQSVSLLVSPQFPRLQVGTKAQTS